MFKGSGVLEMKWYRCCRYYGGLKGGSAGPSKILKLWIVFRIYCV